MRAPAMFGASGRCSAPDHGQGVEACHGGLVPVSSYCPRSSLPATVLGWLAGRLAHLLPPRPPRRGGTRPLSLEVRLDAVAAVLLDGLSYRRAGRAVGISKTEVGDSMTCCSARWAPSASASPTAPSLPASRAWPVAAGDGRGRRGGRGGWAGHSGAATLWVGQPEGPVRRQTARPHRLGPCHLDHPRRPAMTGRGLAGQLS